VTTPQTQKVHRTKGDLFPLPDDYPHLTADGRRQARVAACSLWADLDSPFLRIANPNLFALCLNWFEEYYLKGWSGNKHLYTFKNAPMHHEWDLLISSRYRSAIAGFRDSAKSTKFSWRLPMFLMLSRPRTEVLLVMSNERLGNLRMASMQLQFEENELLMRDFEPDMGRLKAKRFSGRAWSPGRLELPNRALVQNFSVGSHQRGLRTTWAILDDPERDEGVSSDALLAKFDHWFFQTFLPIVSTSCHLSWIGTLLVPRALLYRVVHHEDTRFSGYATGIYKLLTKSDDGEDTSAWPDRYPMKDIRYMMGGGSPDGRVQGFGLASFYAEYQNEPARGEASTLDFRPIRHTYRVLDEGEKRFTFNVLTEKKESYSDWKERLLVGVGVDLAISRRTTADYSSIITGGVDADNTLWVLDTWRGREHPGRVLLRALMIAARFKAVVLGIETNAFQKLALDLVQDHIREARARKDHVPTIRTLEHYGKAMGKGVRILGLQWRFDANRIKLRARGQEDLIRQIQTFSAESLGQTHDDMLDALVNVLEALGAGLGREESKEPDNLPTEEEMEAMGLNPVHVYNAGDVGYYAAVQRRKQRSMGRVQEDALSLP